MEPTLAGPGHPLVVTVTTTLSVDSRPVLQDTRELYRELSTISPEKTLHCSKLLLVSPKTILYRSQETVSFHRQNHIQGGERLEIDYRILISDIFKWRKGESDTFQSQHNKQAEDLETEPEVDEDPDWRALNTAFYGEPPTPIRKRE